MDRKWTHARNKYEMLSIILILSVSVVNSCGTDQEIRDESVLDRELKNYVDRVFSVEEFSIVPGIKIEGVRDNNKIIINETVGCENGRSIKSVEDYFGKKINQYAGTHVLSVNFEETARFLTSTPSAEVPVGGDGKSSFLTGFGMGFLAFGLKKLLLPVFIGAQLLKSVLIAMFLPSILGGLGKFVGKGLSTFSGVSGASAGNNHPNQVEDFEFKDAEPYSNDPNLSDDFSQAETTNQLANVDTMATANSRFGSAHHRISYVAPQNENYYMRRPNKKTDYKVFHKIPSSSMLLTSYDPFYSPLLSRLDAVFQQLGLGNDKSLETERCRERVVCLMYANPAKYAPYSNLVSAQLSRELNELRKPSSDNPDILRFFRYMKAAKDGQDGDECRAHGGCPSLSAEKPSPAMLTTFNDINNLILKKMWMQYASQHWIEAKDIDSSIERLSSELEALSEDAHHRTNYDLGVCYDEEKIQCCLLDYERYKSGSELCDKFLDGNLDLNQLCWQMIHLDLKRFLYRLRPYLPDWIIEKFELSETNQEDIEDGTENDDDEEEVILDCLSIPPSNCELPTDK